MNISVYFFGLTFLSSVHAETQYVELPVIRDEPQACWSGNVELKGLVVMKKGCVATGGVLIRTSNTELNCKGGRIDLNGTGTGIEIDSQGKPLKNVALKNCDITNSKFKSIYIGWNDSDRWKSQHLTHEQQYHLTPQDILIYKTRILNSGSSGIYVDDYVQNVILDEVEIIDSPAMAIYFEFSSKNNILRNSKISGAGKNVHREAVSIDSSSGNLIENNTFSDNPYGGIFLYRNCGEHFASNEKQVIRWMPASHNQIRNNRIDGSRVGVWLASRQSQNMKNAECGLGYYAEGKYTLDDARNNVVSENRISNAEFGVLVEDDNNQVFENQFDTISKAGIRVGTPIRSKYKGLPVINTKIYGNKSNSSAPILKFVAGSSGENNIVE